jgi:hypothetical protein
MRFLLALLAASLAAQTRLQTPTRISDSSSLPATLNTKVTEWRDVNNSGLFWDARAEVGNPASTTVQWYMRDNAGAKVVEFQRTFLGAASNNATLDMHWLPRTDGVRNLGSASFRWGDGHINRVRSNFAVPPTGILELDGDLTVTAGNSLGLSANRIPKIWVQDFDCSGVGCPATSSPWQRNSGTGVVSLVTATDDTTVRKMRWESNDGSGLYWESMATVTGASPGTREWQLIDNAGAPVLRLQRQFAGAVVDDAILDMDFLPATDGARNLGASAKRWDQAHLNKVYTTLFTPGAGASIEIDGSLLPTSAASASAGVGSQSVPFNVGAFRNLYTLAIVPVTGTQVEWFNDLVPQTSGGNLGSVSRRVGTLYTTSIDCSGGTCPSSKWTDGGATTYLIATGDNVAIGIASTSFKLEVSGTSKLDGDTRFGGDLFCVTDGGCDVGDNGFGTVLRPSSGHFASALFTYNGGGSSTIRTSLSGSGLIVNNSGGTQVASISGSTGRISTSAGFTVGGVNGVTASGAACVITAISGGIITGATC